MIDTADLRLPGDLCREALQASCDGVLLIDSAGAVKAFDQKFECLTAGPVTADAVDALFPPGYRPLDYFGAAEKGLVRYCELAMAGSFGVPARVEYIRVRDGLLTAVRLGGEHERAAAERNAWMTAILDATESVIVVLDRDGRFVRFNRAAQNLTSFSEKDVVGRPFWEMILLEEDVESVRAEFARVVSGTAHSHYENRWRMRDGSARILAWSNAVTHDCRGKIEFVVGTAVDVTAVRQSETALASLSHDFLEAQSAGRRNVSRYLHDTVSQYMVVLALSLSKLQRPPGRKKPPELSHTLDLVDRCCRHLRVISYALAPPAFDDLGPAATFEWYARHLREDAGLDVEFTSDAIPADLRPEVGALLLAAVQEWAGMAIRYPGAGKTVISLTNGAGGLKLEFSCNQPANEAVKGILASRVLRERARALGGLSETIQEQNRVSARICISAVRLGQ